MHRFQTHLLEKIGTEIFAACGTPFDEAQIVSEHLVMANLMGMDSHGVVRIPLYYKWIQEGPLRPGAKITIQDETPTTAIVNCNYNFGQVGALRATQTAIEKARQYSIACIVTRNCAHVGRLGHFTQMAAEAGMLGMAFVNSAPAGHSVVPFGGLEGRIAPNPISFAAPGTDHPVLADMAMSTTAQGKLVVYRNQGKQLPEDWIIDANGNPSTDPQAYFGSPRGWILPVGGNVGYKGFSMLILSEILGGLLGSVSISDRTVPDGTNGFCFIAINLKAFLPLEHFTSLSDAMGEYIRSAPPAPGFEKVMMPGDFEFQTLAERRQNGIPLDEITWNSICETANKVGVSVPVEAQ